MLLPIVLLWTGNLAEQKTLMLIAKPKSVKTFFTHLLSNKIMIHMISFGIFNKTLT